jgi:hypothetical protein
MPASDRAIRFLLATGAGSARQRTPALALKDFVFRAHSLSEKRKPI